MNRNFFIGVGLLITAIPAAAADGITVASPNGTVRIHISTGGGRLNYTVSFRPETVIEARHRHRHRWRRHSAKGLSSGRAERYRRDETYPCVRGPLDRTRPRERGQNAMRHEKGGTAYMLDARAYDDGIAFRFVVPGPAGKRESGKKSGADTGTR